MVTDRLESWPVRCALHHRAPAIALCTRCGTFICSQCRTVDSQGLCVCSRCVEGQRIPRVAFEWTDRGLFERFLRTVQNVLLRPNRFARNLDLDGRLAPALKFGLACLIIGQLAFLLWVLVLMRPVYDEQVASVAADLGISTRAYELLRFGMIPLDALVRLALYALLLRLGIALCGARASYGYRHYLRLFSYASAAYLLLIIPLIVGVALAFVYVLLICGYALRYHHRLSRPQTVIATAPLAIGMLLLEITGGF